MRSRSPRLPGALLVLCLLLAALLLGGCGGSGTTVASPSAGTATALPALTGTASAVASGPITPPTASRPTPTVRATTPPPTARPTTTPATTPTPRGQAARPPPSDGLPTVELAALPPEARETIRLIERGGPFPYDRDGITFGNRERLLPLRSSGYYREYTVITPGSVDRGARRVIAGEGDELYYTDDHYDSFRRVVR